MKNLLIISTLALGAFFFGTNEAQAQDQTTATTTVNITLADVISIESAATEVSFSYSSAADYNSSQDYDVVGNLTVTSTKNFNISVKANEANFTDGTNVIPVSVLTISATAGGTMGGTPTAINLSDVDQDLIANAPLGSELTLDLNYEIPAAKSSSSDILGKPAGAYSQVVTYTATAL